MTCPSLQRLAAFSLRYLTVKTMGVSAWSSDSSISSVTFCSCGRDAASMHNCNPVLVHSNTQYTVCDVGFMFYSINWASTIVSLNIYNAGHLHFVPLLTQICVSFETKNVTFY